MLSNEAVMRLLYSKESDSYKVKALQQYLAPYKVDSRNHNTAKYVPSKKC